MFTFEKVEKQIQFDDVSYCEAYQTETILPYTIKQDGEVIGYLFAEKRDMNVLYIQFIEIVDSLKEEGLGTQVVLSLFESFNVQYIEGTVMLDDGGRAYYFWESLGSEMSVSIDEYEDFDFENDISFVLSA